MENPTHQIATETNARRAGSVDPSSTPSHCGFWIQAMFSASSRPPPRYPSA